MKNNTLIKIAFDKVLIMITNNEANAKCDIKYVVLPETFNKKVLKGNLHFNNLHLPKTMGIKFCNFLYHNKL